MNINRCPAAVGFSQTQRALNIARNKKWLSQGCSGSKRAYGCVWIERRSRDCQTLTEHLVRVLTPSVAASCECNLNDNDTCPWMALSHFTNLALPQEGETPFAERLFEIGTCKAHATRHETSASHVEHILSTMTHEIDINVASYASQRITNTCLAHAELQDAADSHVNHHAKHHAASRRHGRKE